MAPDGLLERIQAKHRDREDMLKEEGAIDKRMQARARRLARASCPDHEFKCQRCTGLAKNWHAGKGDPEMVAELTILNLPLAAAKQGITEYKNRLTRDLEKLADQLPIAQFIAETRGLGKLGAAQIIAETGDLNNYSGPAKVWKRMGLAVGADGKRQRMVAGCGKKHPGMSCEKCEASIAQGYNPRRRAIMYNVGESLAKQGREYREVLLERKRYVSAKHEGCKWVEGANDLAHGCGYCQTQARRYMEKRLLREMWRAWRDAA